MKIPVTAHKQTCRTLGMNSFKTSKISLIISISGVITDIICVKLHSAHSLHACTKVGKGMVSYPQPLCKILYCAWYNLDMNIHLMVHNIGFLISAIVGTAAAFFLLFNNKRSMANIGMSLVMFSLVVFIVSHVIGVNTADPLASRNILMFNLSNFFVGMFLVHSVLAYLGKAKSRWYIIAIFYAVGLGFTAFFIFNPDLFLLPSVPKMYFPNYYEAGILNWTRIAYLYVVCLPYIFIEIALAYNNNATDQRLRNQYRYLFYAIMTTSVVGFIANFLVYNIPVDPMWATAFLVFFGVIMAYGGLKYELFNIRIIAKQAFVYALGIVTVGGFIALLDYANHLIQNQYADFPTWIGPFLSAVIVVSIGSGIWRKLREEEILKYEFVTTVTHKFRTPLTHIKWAAENLSPRITAPEDRTQLNYIQNSNEKLVELTSLLMNISETENNDYEYRISRASVSRLAEEVATGLQEQFDVKKLAVQKNIEPELYAQIDESRIKFIIQTFIENAVHYTPAEGHIVISLKRSGKDVVFSVTDSGIGIAPDELSRLFHKFYRGHSARLADTEGMGIGLYMSKEIINRHHGKIWAYSTGSGKGSVFGFLVKEEK